MNDVQQTFTPSLPRLVAVEVELVLANPGRPDDMLTMTLLDAAGQPLATVSKTVKVADCGHVRFAFGGLKVSPGKRRFRFLAAASLAVLPHQLGYDARPAGLMAAPTSDPVSP